MKKTVFALQVIGLIALLPVVVILEMNHVPLHQSASPARITTINRLSEKTAAKISHEASGISLEIFLFKIAL